MIDNIERKSCYYSKATNIEEGLKNEMELGSQNS